MPAHPSRHRMVKPRRWRASVPLIVSAVIAVLGVSAVTYPSAASWVFALNQTQVIERYDESVNDAIPSAEEQLNQAHAYNSDLSSGAVLAANANVPQGEGTSGTSDYDYWSMLSTETGIMARIQIPAIDVDLPIYHGTSMPTLEQGVGHLQGTSLPVGGESTHSTLTAHRGLPEATLFTHLDQVEQGDTFSINTFGEILTYQVITTRVVAPEDTESLRQEAGRDLVTLVTCTPLGVNSHRILVTGERITPTPDEDITAATTPAAPPAFPWWLILYLTSLTLISLYLWWGGRVRAHQRPDHATAGQLPSPVAGDR